MIKTVHPNTTSGIYTQQDELLAIRHWAKELNLFARRPAASLLAGNTQSRFRGRGMDFEEARLYQPGDDIRCIDWRVTARTGKAHTKIFREERERPVLLLVDQRSPMFFGSRRAMKSVVACELASAIGWAALAHSDRVGGLVFGDNSHTDVRPRRSKHAVLNLIQHLADYNHQLNQPSEVINDDSPKSLTVLLEDTLRIAKPGTAVFIISDFHDCDERSEKALYNLSRHCDLTLFAISDPLEMELPKAGRYTVTDGQNRSSLNTADNKLRTRFQEQWQHQRTQLRKISYRVGIPLLEIETSDELPHKLRQLFSLNRKAGGRK
ncbi:MAG: DUF58 domain-containing protein [Cellvibrionaceae bacterium]